MNKKRLLWLAVPSSLLLVMLAIWASSITKKSSQVATSTPSGFGDIIGVVGSGGGGNSGGSGSGGSGSSDGSGGSNNPGNTLAPTPNPTTPPNGPYAVVQTETLGGEAISGSVCNLTQPFSVNFNTPKVGFVTNYIAVDTANGTWTYAYSIPSAGETHDAIGSYTTKPSDTEGTLTLTMTGQDHVVFKGFDGKMPTNYSFNLVPSTTTGCP